MEAELVVQTRVTTWSIFMCMNVCDSVCVCVFLLRMKDFKGRRARIRARIRKRQAESFTQVQNLRG